MSNKRKQVVLTYDDLREVYLAKMYEVSLIDFEREELGVWAFDDAVEIEEMAKIGHPLLGATLMYSAYLSIILDDIAKHPEVQLPDFTAWLKSFAE